MDLMEYRRRIIASSPHLSHAEGAVASFPDGTDLPLKSLIVDINPIQDLHGQENPYPAGGGKNKLPYASKDTDSKNGVTWTKNSDGSITFSGTCSASVAMTFAEFKLPAGDYLFSNVGSTFAYTGGNRPTVYVRDLDNALSLANIGFGQSANGISFSLSAETNIRFYAVFQTDNVVSGVLYPMIRLASVTDATYAPYENICPISGWTEINVQRTGKNLFEYDENKVTTATTNVGTTRAIYPLGISGRTVSFSAIQKGESTTSIYINIGRRKNNIVTVEDSFIRPNEINQRTFTLANDEEAVLMSASPTENSLTLNLPKYNIQVELNSEITAYEPYTGRSITINLGQTVYGGKLDVLSGELVAYPYYASYNGETLTGRWVSDRDKYVSGTTPTIGAQVVDMSGMGTTYTLDPQTVRSLVGHNNIFADTGNVVLDYWAHP